MHFSRGIQPQSNKLWPYCLKRKLFATAIKLIEARKPLWQSIIKAIENIWAFSFYYVFVCHEVHTKKKKQQQRNSKHKRGRIYRNSNQLNWWNGIVFVFVFVFFGQMDWKSNKTLRLLKTISTYWNLSFLFQKLKIFCEVGFVCVRVFVNHWIHI